MELLEPKAEEEMPKTLLLDGPARVGEVVVKARVDDDVTEEASAAVRIADVYDGLVALAKALAAVTVTIVPLTAAMIGGCCECSLMM